MSCSTSRSGLAAARIDAETEYRTDELIARLPVMKYEVCVKPRYDSNEQGSKAGLFVKSLERHITDEGVQLQNGLITQGYTPYGHGYGDSKTDIGDILLAAKPSTLFIQDKREWDREHPWGDFRDKRSHFTRSKLLQEVFNTFKVTMHKDTHARQGYNMEFANEVGLHAWLVYYHQNIIRATAPFVRAEHLIRIYHSIDMLAVPELTEERDGAVLSGAVSGAYPLRKRLINGRNELYKTKYLQHPGYTAGKNYSNDYLKTLVQHRVSICTTSKWGFALRKIIEAVVCGCVCITDLPVDDVLPVIDEGLVRVHPDSRPNQVSEIIQREHENYDQEYRIDLANRAMQFYDYRESARRMCEDIENLRRSY